MRETTWQVRGSEFLHSVLVLMDEAQAQRNVNHVIVASGQSILHQ